MMIKNSQSKYHDTVSGILITIIGLFIFMMIFPFTVTCQNNPPPMDYKKAIQLIRDSGTGLRITSQHEDTHAIMKTSQPGYISLLAYLERSEVIPKGKKIFVEEGRAVEADIPFGITHTLEFSLEDGSVINFEYGNLLIWLIGEDSNYCAIVNYDLGILFADLEYE